MKRLPIVATLAVTCLSMLGAGPAHAQATRTWGSNNGDDAFPCSLTSPCKTFAGAISKTAINGEIYCLDSGSYGAVTITKSITIDCHEAFAGIPANTAQVTNGIVISIAAGNANDPLRTVRLRTSTSLAPGSTARSARVSGSSGSSSLKPPMCSSMTR